MKKTQPLVSVIVVNYNGKHFLKACFDSLLVMDYPQEQLEILLVDNGSIDGSLEFIRENYPGVKVFQNDINNYARANNLGIKAARGEFLALLNNDVKVDKEWLTTLVRTAQEESSTGAVGSKILFMDGTVQSLGHLESNDFYWGDIGFGNPDNVPSEGTKEVTSICGCSVLYRKKCLADAGLLDEDFNLFMEDVDMSIRCRKKGWKLLICRESILYHELHGTVKNQENARHWQEINRLLLIAKHWPEKLPKALAGRQYFSGEGGCADAMDISNVLGKVYGKLVKEHGMQCADKISAELFSEARKIYNFNKDQKIASQVQALASKDREIASQVQALASKDREIASQVQALVSKDREIASQVQALASKDREIASQVQALASKDREIASQVQALASKDREIASQVQALVANDLEMKSHKLLIQQLRKELSDIYGSTGYRYLLKPSWDFLWGIKAFLKSARIFFVSIKSSAGHFISSIRGALMSLAAQASRKFEYLVRVIKKMRGYVFYPFPHSFFKNSLRGIYLSHLKYKTFPRHPERLSLMIISRCNLRCKFCDVPERNYHKSELSKDEAIRIMDSAVRLGVKQLDITGGEPLLHKDVFEIVAYAASVGLKVTLSTNGILIKKYMPQIVESDIACVTVSVDGFADTHNDLRCYSGNYSEIIESLEYLKLKKKGVAVSFVVTNQNIQELEKLHDFFKEREIFFAFFPVVNKPDLYLRSDVDKKTFMRFVEKIKKRGEVSPTLYRYYKRMLDYYRSGTGKVRCLGLYREFGVDVNGDMFPCCVWENKDRPVNVVGNLLNDAMKLEELWHSSEIQNARVRIFTEGCGGCYNPDICSFSNLTGMDFLLKGAAHSQKKVLALKPKAPDRPSQVHMRLTLKCNLSCRHCDIWKTKNSQPELDTQGWKIVISKLRDWLGPFKLELAGGEMFLRRDIVEIIQFASDRGISSNITTNAMAVNRDLAKEIIKAGLRAVTISLDGYHSRTHNYIRNHKNAHNIVMEAAANFSSGKQGGDLFDVNLATVISAHNLDELESLVMLTKKGIFSSITFQALDHNFHAPYHPLWFKSNEFWPQDLAKVNRAIDNLISLKEKGYSINNSFKQLSAVKEYFSNPLCADVNACSTGDKNFIVNEMGQVLLCWNMPPVASLLDDMPETIWKSQLARKRREEINRCKRTCRMLNCNYL